MARISGVEIPSDKRIDIALTYIYGIGRVNSYTVLKKASIDAARRVNTLTDEELNRITKIIDKEFMVEGDLRQQIHASIKRLKEIGSYRGLRHMKALPARGQRTRSNARTKRGKRITIGAMKKDDRAKLDVKQPAEVKK
ncbi:30S ribosomal protein S13 [Candidatus Gottesmanbacteria bacterium RBG_16_43_7]|uniref:Small ribosomal subunit protein uS13 n=1 Tax=Candidatus Gottesmanbacteria bacterium RBG_16_43_7 TaxID=1798373 RepID=A0A1F5ZAJ5_9BACT|nr:MAG: 30S ribosomal protein S13 [Candidatus Gottesmanbacteria bacterium RBG_16_43_7]